MTISSDFAGLAGLSIATIGTVAMTKEIVKAMQGYTAPPRRRSYKRRK